MMPRGLNTLYARLAAVLVGLFLLIALLYGGISYLNAQRYLQELTQDFNRDLAQRIVDDRLLVRSGRLDREALSATFSAYMEVNPSIEIYLLDATGRIEAFSADPGKVKRLRVDLAPIHAFLSGAPLPLLGDDPRSPMGRKAFSVTEVPMAGEGPGYLYVVLRGEAYDEAAGRLREHYLWRQSLWAVIGSLGFALLAGLLLFYRLTRRLNGLARTMGQFQASDFQTPPKLESSSRQGRDEIDQLTQAFTQMALRMGDQLEALRDQDRQRRAWVAQISHDLRTPLAALHGYLETLELGQQRLAPAERDYLGSALRQSRQLRRMVEELLALAQLEARDVQIQPEPMVLAELLQDVVAKFLPQAQRQGVALSYHTELKRLVVAVDVALMERALDNLIANALEHGGQAITIELQQIVPDMVEISVRDQGPGIPPHQLSDLFEPFVQGGRKQGHVGLGLAIVKRIAELHGGRVRAENHPEGGACFTLCLPLATAAPVVGLTQTD